MLAAMSDKPDRWRSFEPPSGRGILDFTNRKNGTTCGSAGGVVATCRACGAIRQTVVLAAQRPWHLRARADLHQYVESLSEETLRCAASPRVQSHSRQGNVQDVAPVHCAAHANTEKSRYGRTAIASEATSTAATASTKAPRSRTLRRGRRSLLALPFNIAQSRQSSVSPTGFHDQAQKP